MAYDYPLRLEGLFGPDMADDDGLLGPSAGLFGPGPDRGFVRRNMVAAALASLGGNMLAANRPGVSAGEAFGHGVRGAMDTLNNYQANYGRNALIAAKINEANRKAKTDRRAQLAILGPYHPLTGGTPWQNPDTGQVSYGGGMVEKIADPTQRSVFEAAAMANPTAFATGLMKPAPGPTLAQSANNLEVETARKRIAALSSQLKDGESLRDYIRRATQRHSDTGRENPSFDPWIDRDFRTASNRMVGDDRGYDEFIQSLEWRKPMREKAPKTEAGEDKSWLSRLLGGSSPKAKAETTAPGTRARNPKTGEVIEWDGKEWKPVR